MTHDMNHTIVKGLRAVIVAAMMFVNTRGQALCDVTEDGIKNKNKIY